MKRILFIVALFVVESLTAGANDFEVNGIFYDINSGGQSVSVINPKLNTFYPEYYPDYSGLKDVVIPASVTYNGKQYSVTSIGSSAFQGCTGLTSVAIPNSVTSIGMSAFSGCSGLTSVNIPNSVTTIRDDAFRNCCSLTSVTIPNSVTSIGECVFEECRGLTSVVIGNSVTSIEWRAFFDCCSLTSVNIPNSVTSIGLSAFSGCSGLTSVNIPNSVTSIGSSAFSGCSGLTSVNIPNSVTSMGSSAFSGCSGLTSVAIPDSVTSISEKTFSGCSGLTSVNIPNSVTTIRDDAFRNCSSLTSVIIPNSVTTIRWGVFYGCRALTSVVIGNSVTSIRDMVFYECSELSEVYSLNKTPPIIEGTECFPERAIKVFVNVGCARTYRYADGWKNFSYNIIDGIPVKSISLSKSETTLKLSTKEQLTASVWPDCASNKAVKWTTSNREIATVDSTGIVKAVSVGNATITATSTDGSNLSASCEITVEPIAYFLNGKETHVRVNKANTTIDVTMNNLNAISAFQCDIYLPEHTSVAYDEDEDEYNFTLAPERKTSTHTITANNLGSGHYRIMCASSKSANLKLNEGTLFSINIDLDEYLKVGNYEIRISDILLYESDGYTYHTTADLNIPFIVDDYELGDANGDDVIDVGDVVSVINYTLGKPESGIFVKKAADANEDGIINVGDVITIFNKVLNKSILATNKVF